MNNDTAPATPDDATVETVPPSRSPVAGLVLVGEAEDLVCVDDTCAPADIPRTAQS